MLDPAHFTVVAGQNAKDAAEAILLARVKPSTERPGCLESESLCAAQQHVHGLGFRDVELVPTLYGWSVRSGSGLDNFSILYGYRKGDGRMTYEQALAKANEWVNQNPSRRFAWVRNASLPKENVLAEGSENPTPA